MPLRDARGDRCRPVPGSGCPAVRRSSLRSGRGCAGEACVFRAGAGQPAQRGIRRRGWTGSENPGKTGRACRGRPGTAGQNRSTSRLHPETARHLCDAADGHPAWPANPWLHNALLLMNTLFNSLPQAGKRASTIPSADPFPETGGHPAHQHHEVETIFHRPRRFFSDADQFSVLNLQIIQDLFSFRKTRSENVQFREKNRRNPTKTWTDGACGG